MRSPNTFGRVALRRLFSIVNGATPDSQNPDFWDGDIPWVTPEDLSNRDSVGLAKSKRTLTESGYRSCGTTTVPPGSIVLSTRAPIGNLAIAEKPICTNQGCKSLVPRSPLATKFFYYQLSVLTEELNRKGRGTTFLELSTNELGAFKVHTPSVPEQEQIANFLDEQTARIDALIAEKEQLLVRLAELRYATVTWAVTGGLHQDRGTYETGHAFVPNLPMGWAFGGLTKYIGPVVDYRGKTPEKVQDGVLLVTARNIRDGELDYEASAEFVRAEDYEEIMRRGRPAIGDVLFTMEAPLGQVANVDRVDIALAQRVVKFRGLDDVLNNYFLKYWLMGDVAQSTLRTLATGSTAEGIKASKLGQIPLAVPSLDEQTEIVVFLDNRREAIDSATSHVLSHIERLREYRSSLISAAVTGQLDINSYQEAA